MPDMYGDPECYLNGTTSLSGMLLVCGALVNGPYALITTAVSADLVSSAI